MYLRQQKSKVNLDKQRNGSQKSSDNDDYLSASFYFHVSECQNVHAIPKLTLQEACLLITSQ